MQKRSHALLASALLRQEEGFSARRYAWAFLFGSFQPDCNPLSYLKGSLRCRKFGGHTYGNAQPYILSRIRRLQNRSRWTLWQYYTLGKLTHYVADAFTYPHNDHFPDGLLDHHRYERDLRRYFPGYLARNGTAAPADPRRDLLAELDRLHRQYVSAVSGVDRDCRYILLATSLLMAGCCPAAGVG